MDAFFVFESIQIVSEKTLHFLHCPQEVKGVDFKPLNEWDIMRGSLETNNVAVEAKAFGAVGGFDENRFYFTNDHGR